MHHHEILSAISQEFLSGNVLIQTAITGFNFDPTFFQCKQPLKVMTIKYILLKERYPADILAMIL